MLMLITVGCFGDEPEITGRIVSKEVISSGCSIDFRYGAGQGTITCREKAFVLKLNDNDAWQTKSCYVSETIYNNANVGEVFTCIYREES